MLVNSDYWINNHVVKVEEAAGGPLVTQKMFSRFKVNELIKIFSKILYSKEFFLFIKGTDARLNKFNSIIKNINFHIKYW